MWFIWSIPNAFGPRTAFRSYSNLPTGSSPADRAQLAQPIAGKLFFAGEATHDRDPATLHGAYLSGICEARRIAMGL
jgi:polyamine oxidase